MTSLLITGGRVVDPASQFDQTADVLIREGRIARIGVIPKNRIPKGIKTIDARGCVVCPGLIDIHVHLREPGQSGKETIKTGAAAAARGGFTTILGMPNTAPPVDNASAVSLIREKAAKDGVVNVLVAGAISKGLAGEELAPIGSLKQAGVVAITDDGHCVQNNELMRRAVEYAKMFELPVLDHCQDYSMVTDGVMHEGYYSLLLGLRGWPAAGEEIIVARNIILAELTGHTIHCQHISSAGSVRLLRDAQKRGVPISGEACPHHFTLTDAALAGSDHFWPGDGQAFAAFQPRQLPHWPAYDTNFKMNPPLRSAKDREAILGGLSDGTLSIIGSDHAPHATYEKEVEFDYAPFGIIGLETELPLSLMALVHSGRLSLAAMLAKFTINPARLLKIKKGTLSEGADADVTIFNPDAEWTYTPEQTASLSRNSPFFGWRLKGRVMFTIVGGQVVFDDSATS